MTERRDYKKQPQEIWDLVRTDYAQGASAPWLALRYDVSVGAIRRRARFEGWTKRALAEAGFTPEPLGEARDAAMDAAQMATHACRHALARGNVVQAQGLARLAGSLTRLHKVMPRPVRVPTPEQLAQTEALRSALRALIR